MSIFTVTVQHLSGNREIVSTRVRYKSDEYDTRSAETIATEKAVEKLFGTRAWFVENCSNPGYGQIFKRLPGQNWSTSVTNMVHITVTGG